MCARLILCWIDDVVRYTNLFKGMIGALNEMRKSALKKSMNTIAIEQNVMLIPPISKNIKILREQLIRFTTYITLSVKKNNMVIIHGHDISFMTAVLFDAVLSRAQKDRRTNRYIYIFLLSLDYDY